MSADLLRTAAALMRERAEAATRVWKCDRWEAFDAAADVYEKQASPAAYLMHHVATADEHGAVLLTSPWDDTEIVHHAASWHPAVALAVADWLDEEWAQVDLFGAEHPEPRCECSAHTVARAYLGSES